MTSPKLDLEKNILQNSKIPKWLKATGNNFHERQHLDIDDVEEDGDVRSYGEKPPFRWKIYKKVKKRIAEMEEMHEWIEKKGKKELETGETKVDNFLDHLDSALNSMI